jgi:hypothetical protein
MDVPVQLIASLSPADRTAVAQWWAALSDTNQSEFVALCDPRRDECFFGTAEDDPATPVPLVLGGRFVPKEDTTGWAEWNAELFDYLVCHPEFAEPLRVRIFRICSRHQLPRSVLEAGKIPSDFQCPLASENCPIRGLLRLSPSNQGR